MPWTWICPAKSGAFGDFAGQVKENGTGDNAYCTFPYNSEGAAVSVPSLQKLYLMMMCSISNYDKNWLKFRSKNHSLKIITETNASRFKFTLDDKDVGPLISLSTSYQYRKIYITIDSSTNSIKFYDNGGVIAEYQGDLFDGEPITSMWFNETYSSNNFGLKWAIASECSIPQSASVRTIDNPIVETDWVKGDDGSYETSEAGKKMKISLSANCATDGKEIWASAPFLDNAVGGGNVTSINIHSDDFDKDYILTDKPSEIGFITGDNVVFTSKDD